MKDLKEFINESINDLLKPENKFINHSEYKSSSTEYGVWLDEMDKSIMKELIPYKELNLPEPSDIRATFEKESGSNDWEIIFKWTDKTKNIYVCNGWKSEKYDLSTARTKTFEIINHLIKSRKARRAFKNTMILLINKYLKVGASKEDIILDFRSKKDQLNIYNLEELINI